MNIQMALDDTDIERIASRVAELIKRQEKSADTGGISGDGYVSVAEAARMLNVSPPVIYNMMRSGKLEYCSISDRVKRIPIAHLREIAESRSKRA